MFSTTTVPRARCKAYTPPNTDCTEKNPYAASTIECPDAFTAPSAGVRGGDGDGVESEGRQQVLIGSLGCGGLGTTAWWTQAQPWIPR